MLAQCVCLAQRERFNEGGRCSFDGLVPQRLPPLLKELYFVPSIAYFRIVLV